MPGFTDSSVCLAIGHDFIIFRPRGDNECNRNNSEANLPSDEPPDQHNHSYVLLHPSHVCVGIGIAKAKDQVVPVQDFADVVPSVKGDK
jgi:hypothetical protein